MELETLELQNQVNSISLYCTLLKHLLSPSVFLTVLCIKASLVAQRVKHLPAMWENWVQSSGQEDPLEKEMATHSSILAWKIHGQRSLVGCSSWGHKESDTTEQLVYHGRIKKKTNKVSSYQGAETNNAESKPWI